ncbi:MAG: long-chain fatty acid--CoA ligase [Acidobacteria bacterium]|nr:long-chain fatty acid--CoA ligase [Acidobacteriota bacterium]
MTEKTVLDFFRNDVARPRKEHLVHASPEGSRVLGTEVFLSKTVRLSRALAGLGVSRGDRVILLSENRPEWAIADLAILGAGAVNVPIYPTLQPAQIAYQVNDSAANVAIVDSALQLKKFHEIQKECPSLKHLVLMDFTGSEKALGFDQLLEGAPASSEEQFWDAASRVDPKELMTIIYTSGTTGEPKGVMLSHENIAQNIIHSVPKVAFSEEDVALEFLPLCHSFERTLGYGYMYVKIKRIFCAVAYVAELLPKLQPTFFAGVPRLYEKIFAKIQEKVASAPPLKQSLFNWAVSTGKEMSAASLAHKDPGIGTRLQYWIADLLVLSEVRKAFGGKVRYCASGGAPLPLFANEFFHAIGVPILEGYGLSETSPIISLNFPGAIRLGTVGKVLENLEVKIADDGEIIVRGPSIMSGYWKKPEATKEVFDKEGFFHTGDIGKFDADGFLAITDRKKDLIITAGGKNVAPAPIESELKRMTLIDNAVVIGDRRPFLVALFSPNPDEMKRFAAQHGLPGDDPAALTTHPKVLEALQKHVDSVNKNLARFEQVKKFSILPEQLTMERGHLTPTLKVKRRVAEKEFARLIELMYSGGGGGE